MSASPATGPAGPAVRKKPAVSIFTAKKKVVKKQLPAQAFAAGGQIPLNGQRAVPGPPPQTTTNGAHTTTSDAEPDPSTYQDYPIMISKSALSQGLHHHAMRFHAKVGPDGRPIQIDPYTENQFTRPLHLHRRNARDQLQLADQSDASGVDDKEKESNLAKRMARQEERTANQALIAPMGDANATKKVQRKKPQKKVEDVYYDDNNPKQKARAQLRYEEARPWHLEDFESKNKWVGSYEEPLSNTNVMFEVTDGGFKLVLIEKWYRMIQTDRIVGKLDSEAVERQMALKFQPQRWHLGTQKLNEEQRAEVAKRQRAYAAFKQREEDGGEDAPSFVKQEDYRADVDEIDFEYDNEFQDDDEGAMYADADADDAKEIEARLRIEMRSANLAGTGVKDEDKDWDEEETRQKKADAEEKQKAKRARKLLRKKEARQEYASDSDDENRYDSSSETSDSEEERERIAEEEAKKKASDELAAATANGSGASSKGTNTPTHRHEKRTNGLGGLKRDADGSELSGNESGLRRKKPKLNGTLTPRGAVSPSSLSARSRGPSGNASGSETDASAAPTRAGRTTLRLKNSPPGSPRNGTPRGSPGGSRAASPVRAAMLPFPTLEEVRAVIPEEGIAIGELVKLFKERSKGKSGEFIALVKVAGRQDGGSKRIVPRKGEE